MSVSLHYLESVIDLYRYYQKLGAGAIGQLSQQQLHKRFSPDDNNIAVIVKHLAGNMKSRFTHFLTSDGEKPWRNRDGEFEDTLQHKEDILNCWNQSWELVITEISKLNEEQIQEHVVYIRNQGHSIIEALNRQLGHYAYHTGQIVYIAKSICGDRWQSLSIPKGKSDQFNQQQFGKDRVKTSFIKDWLKRKNIVDPI